MASQFTWADETYETFGLGNMMNRCASKWYGTIPLCLIHLDPPAFVFGSFLAFAFLSDFSNFSFLLSAISLARCRSGILFSSYFSALSSPA